MYLHQALGRWQICLRPVCEALVRRVGAATSTSFVGGLQCKATPAYTEDRQDDRSDVASTPQCQPATCHRVGVSRPMALPIGHEARPISPSAASTLQFGRWHAGIKLANSCILMMSENESETSIHAPLSSTATQSVCSAARSRRRVSHGRAERGPLAGACAHPPTAAPRPRAAVAGGAARLPAAAWCATVCLTRNCTRDAACPTPLCMPPPSLGVRGAPLDPSRGLASRLRWCAAAAATAVEIRADALTLALLAAPGADVRGRSPPGWIKCHCGPLVMPSAGDSHLRCLHQDVGGRASLSVPAAPPLAPRCACVTRAPCGG